MKTKKILLIFCVFLFMPAIVFAGGNSDDSLCAKGYTQNGPYCEKLTNDAYRKTGTNDYLCPAPSGSHEFETVQTINSKQCLYQYAINPYGDQKQYGEYDSNKSPANQTNGNSGNKGEVKPDTSIDPKLDYSSICANEGPRRAVKIIGNVIQIAKWVTPILIIVLGMLDFGKAVISNDEKAINKATSSLIKRIIAGIVVFLIPTIVIGILNLIKVTNNIQSDSNFGACTTCLFDPSNCD